MGMGMIRLSNAYATCGALWLLTTACSSSRSATPVATADAATAKDAGHPKMDAGKRSPDARRPDDAGEAGAACTTVMMDFTGQGGFFDSPFPSDARLTATGLPDLTTFPNSDPPNPLVASVLGVVQGSALAFSVTASVYFRFTGAIDATGMDDPHASLAPGATAFLVDVDPASPSFGKRSATKGIFLPIGGPYGAPNLLAMLPYPGMTLQASTRYAAVVLRTQSDANGKAVCAAPAMTELAAGTQPAGMSGAAFTEYKAALTALDGVGIAASDVAALSVYTTDNPAADFVKVRDAMQALPLPKVSAAWTPTTEIYPTYCVFQNTIPMPDYQAGTPPYSPSGGNWVFDESGAPVLQEHQEANLVVTIPRSAMPASGYPIVNMVRTGAGGNRPLVDRGQEATNGGPSITPGTGPALYYAAAGFAGATIDGPLGGLRNPDGTSAAASGDEDYTIFNVANPVALRDNIRESAAELSLTASILSALSFDASSCPGATTPDGGAVRFDGTKMGIMSHSMGSTISPLTLAYEPRYKVAILSGAGGSWIENVIYKLLPSPPLQPAVELLLGITAASGYSLGEGDPALNLFQWAAESADAPVYDSRTIQHPVGAPPRSVLKVQGIIDHYILPNICNSTSLSLGLDLGGPELDTEAALSMYTPLDAVIDLGGRSLISLPASGNVKIEAGVATAVVSQFPADGIEDGHEVIFQTNPPKHQYECFLASFAQGKTPRLPALSDGGAIVPCE